MKLEGIRVLDLSRFLPGPHLAMMMADHGADVIKVEDTKSGDPARAIGPAEGGHTVYFRNANRGKRSLAVDLKNEAGREAFLRLAETADVILETFRPGVVDRLGIGYEAVRARAPQIVYASISAFGQSGPYRDRPAHDLSVNALAGIASLSVDGDGKPAMACLPPSDMGGSLMALAGILMALLRRETTGRGDYLDLSMFDTVVSWTAHVAGRVFADGLAPDPSSQRTQAEWVAWFTGRDICFAPVLDLKEAFDDPHLAARDMLAQDSDGASHLGIPIKFQEEPGRIAHETPALGQHSTAILREIGYGEAECAALARDGIILQAE